MIRFLLTSCFLASLSILASAQGTIVGVDRPNSSRLTFMSFLPNGEWITASRDLTLKIWDGQTGSSAIRWQGQFEGGKFVNGILSESKDIVFLGTTENQVIAISTATGNELWRYQIPSFGPWRDNRVEGVSAMALDDDILAFGTCGGKVAVLNSNSGELLVSLDSLSNGARVAQLQKQGWFNFSPRISRIEFFEESNEMLVGGWEMPIRIVDRDSWQVVDSLVLGDHGCDAMRTLPNSNLLLASSDQGVWKYDILSREQTGFYALDAPPQLGEPTLLQERWYSSFQKWSQHLGISVGPVKLEWLDIHPSTMVAPRKDFQVICANSSLYALTGDSLQKLEIGASEVLEWNDCQLAIVQDNELKFFEPKEGPIDLKNGYKGFWKAPKVLANDCETPPIGIFTRPKERSKQFHRNLIQSDSLSLDFITGRFHSDSRDPWMDSYSKATIGEKRYRREQTRTATSSSTFWVSDKDTLYHERFVGRRAWGDHYFYSDSSWAHWFLTSKNGEFNEYVGRLVGITSRGVPLSPDSMKVCVQFLNTGFEPDSIAVVDMSCGEIRVFETLSELPYSDDAAWLTDSLFITLGHTFDEVSEDFEREAVVYDAIQHQALNRMTLHQDIDGISALDDSNFLVWGQGVDGDTLIVNVCHIDSIQPIWELRTDIKAPGTYGRYNDVANAVIWRGSTNYDGEQNPIVVAWVGSDRVARVDETSPSRNVGMIDEKTLAIERESGEVVLWDLKGDSKRLCTILFEGQDWVVFDEHGRFDCNNNEIIARLKLGCEGERLTLLFWKDILYTPGLLGMIRKEDERLSSLPKLQDFHPCAALPQLEELNRESSVNSIPFQMEIGHEPLTNPSENDQWMRGANRGYVEIRVDGVARDKIDYNQMTEDGIQNGRGRSFAVDSKEFEKWAKDTTFFNLQLVPVSEVDVIWNGAMKSFLQEGRRWGRNFEISEAGRRERQQPKFYGVFLGVNDNPAQDELAPLSFAVDDAQSVHEMMGHAASGFFENRVETWLLSDAPQADDKATEEAFGRVMSEIAAKSKPNDVLMLYFAGHGVLNEDQRFIFLTSEAYRDDLGRWSGLDMDELKEQLSQIKANNRFLVFDACHSGAVTDQFDVASRGTSAEEFYLQKELARLGENQKLAILAASAPTQKAYEPPELKHGLLTFHLLSAMGNQNSERANYLDVNNWLDQTKLGVERYSDKTTLKGAQNPSVRRDETFTVGKLDDSLRNRLADFQPVTVISRFNVTLPSGDAAAEKGLRRRVEESFKLHQSDDSTHPIYDQNRLDGVEIDLRFATDKRGKKTTLTLVVSRSSLVVTTEGGKVDLTDPNDIRQKIVMALREVKE